MTKFHRDASRPEGPCWVIDGVDGTHMGVAVTWWAAVAGNDTTALAIARDVIPAAEMLRSSLEVCLGLAGWIARNDGVSADDGGVRVLRSLAAEPAVLSPAQRALCLALANQLTDDPGRTSFTVPEVPAVTATSLMLLLSTLIEHRFAVPKAAQLEVYREAVIDAMRRDEGTSGS